MSRKQRRVFWPVVVVGCIVLGALAFVAARPRRVREHKAIANPIRVSPTPMPNGIGARALDPVQNVRITIYDVGIYPRELHLEKGLISVAIEDRTGNSDGLVVQREVGNAHTDVGRVQRFANHWRGRGEFRLTPGSYVIFDASRPTSRAKLVVEP